MEHKNFALNSDLLDIIQVGDVHAKSNIALNANTLGQNITVDVSKDGYKAIGILGYNFSRSYSECLSLSRIYVKNDLLNFTINNTSNNNVSSADLDVNIIYVKNISGA